MRSCRVCGEEKPLTEYYVSRRSKVPNPSAYSYECKVCTRQRVSSTTDPHKKRNYSLRRRYGITQEDYDIMLTEQGGACACCGTTEHQTRWNHFCIDHDHKTGKVRGLLCKSCNIALGEVKDNTGTLYKMIEYLDDHS